MGTVIAASDGPCYQVETNDGVRYALHGSGGTTLERGTTVRVQIAPMTLKIYCGPGRPARIVKLTPL